MLGGLMIASAFGLGVIYTGLHSYVVAKKQKVNKYTINKKNVDESISKILPNDVDIFYICNGDDLNHTCKSLSRTLSQYHIDGIRCHYASKGVCGLAYRGANVTIIFVNNILENYNLVSARLKLYDTIFHELYHILLDTSNEKTVSDMASKTIRRNKDKLLPAFVKID